MSEIIENQNYSTAMPLWKLALYSTASLGIYDLIWTYRNWKMIKIEKNKKISPVLRTVFSSIITINFFFDFLLFKEIYSLTKPKLKIFNYIGIFTLVFTYNLLLLYGREPLPYKFIYFLKLLPLTVIQFSINKYFLRKGLGK